MPRYSVHMTAVDNERRLERIISARRQALGLDPGEPVGETEALSITTLKLLASQAVFEEAKRWEQSLRSEAATLGAVEALESDQEVTYMSYQKLADTLSILDTLDHYDLDGRVGMACAKLRKLLKEFR